MAAHYYSASEREYFGWKDAAHATPSKLADLFIERFPEIVEVGWGSDWPYAGWYLEMLHLTYPDAFPIAYADGGMPTDYLLATGENNEIHIPLPPPGLADDATVDESDGPQSEGPWGEDKYWTDALETYHRLREGGQTRMILDLATIDKVIVNGDGSRKNSANLRPYI